MREHPLSSSDIKPSGDAPKTLARSAVRFFFGTVLSRCSGFFREVALSAWFGATPLLAAFFIAYRFSQLLRRLFGESTLLASFSPHFEQLRHSDPEKASSFFRDLFASMSTTLGGLILILEVALFSWWKWGALHANAQEILFLTMVMLPGVLFICLYALFSALLQSDRKYFLPSVAPVFFNVVFLLILWCVKDWAPKEATAALAAGVTLAFFVQWLSVASSTVPFLKNLQWNGVKLWAPELKKMVSAMGVTMIGIGAVQINSFVDTLFARVADPSGSAYLYYAIRLYQLPLALFGIALSSALIPPLARARQSGDRGLFLTLLQFSMRRSLMLMIPMTVVLLAFGDTIVNLVYRRGAFDLLATLETTTCLWGYALGLIPAVLILLFASAFYAQKDFKTPLKASLLSVVINLILNLVFIYGFQWGCASVAVATSIAAWINGAYLFASLSRKEGAFIDQKTGVTAGKVTLGACLAGLLTLLIGRLIVETSPLPRDFLSQLLHVGVYGGVFLLLFFSYAWMMKIHELFQMMGIKISSVPTNE